MSAQTFDELTKALAQAKSRRQALKILAAAALGGGALVTLAPKPAEAQGKEPPPPPCKQPCGTDLSCCA